MKKSVTLIIMDGYGNNPSDYGNAIKAAKTPNLDGIFAENPTAWLGASGMDVGLPDGQMGNSEVGHTNIGAGRIVYQKLTLITKSIMDGNFFDKPALLKAIENCKANDTAFHLIGLLSDGGVHSHNSHLYALLKMAKDHGLTKVYVHALLDGRDVPPSSGKDYIIDCEKEMTKIGVGKIATISGRYYAMDRDNRWERVSRAYNALAFGDGNVYDDPAAYVEASYAKNITDEFVEPGVCGAEGRIAAGDSVIFFNFRPDRAREITRTFVDEKFDGFERKNGFFPLHYVCMSEYDASMPNVDIVFPPQSLKISLDNNFGEYISKQGLTQLRIAETEKYAHVTFFFNGGQEQPFEGEDRALIASPKVATYDLKPEMSAYEVTDEVIARIESGKYDVIILNFANCDMVGHTGIFEAAEAAAETVDICVGRVKDAILKAGGVALITADHGNAERMYYEDGSPFTAHTTNPVPFALVGAENCKLKQTGKLADIAPTMLDLMGVDIPGEMSGESLIVR